MGWNEWEWITQSINTIMWVQLAQTAMLVYIIRFRR
jgi:hypothetical protein